MASGRPRDEGDWQDRGPEQSGAVRREPAFAPTTRAFIARHEVAWELAFAAEGKIAACRASIGGWDRGSGDRGNFGVRLSMGTPDALMKELDAP